MNNDDTLAQRYEEVRQALVDQHQGVRMWGFVILRTKGVAAWVKSWREHGGGEVAHAPDSSAPRAARISATSEEVVRVLAAMIWAVQQEEGAHHDA